jgi:hypothetical protein
LEWWVLDLRSINYLHPCNKNIPMKTLTLSFIALILLTECNDKQSTVNDSSLNAETTEQVLKHHWDAFQANDLEETMADYVEESVLITPDRTYKGLSEIRENFIVAFTVFPKDSTTFQLDKSIVQGDVGYIIWKAESPKINLSFGTDTFIIRNGKIVRQTYAGVNAP